LVPSRDRLRDASSIVFAASQFSCGLTSASPQKRI
jgi:hypothetical protein